MMNREQELPEDGVRIEFLSKETLKDSSFEEKLDLVLDKVRNNMILVLEEALTPEEKKELITKSVEEINEEFPGIEFSGLEESPGLFSRVVNGVYNFVGMDRRRGLTIVGNSNVMEKVKESETSVSLNAKHKPSD